MEFSCLSHSKGVGINLFRIGELWDGFGRGLDVGNGEFSGHEGKGRDSVLERCGPRMKKGQGGSAKGGRRGNQSKGRGACLLPGMP